jgi:MOSC domain-containing protein YiiM
MTTEPATSQNERSILQTTPPQRGRVVWLGVRPGHRQPTQAVDQVMLRVGSGLVGDRFHGTPSSKRQVTLIQAEHLSAIASFLARQHVDPALLRRNIVVQGLNLLALKNTLFRVGDALLETSGPCHPCSRMEEQLGLGGYHAMRGHGGITARVVEGGIVRCQDAVRAVQRCGR